MTIIIGGTKHDTSPVQSLNWMDHGLSFPEPNAMPRELACRWCVLHWTASERTGEAGAAQIHRTLMHRGLSVEFAITNEGTIWQFVDPVEQRCRHCSRVNRYSVGVEVSGIGWAGKPGRVLRGDSAKREVYEDRIHGWKTTWLDYLEPQHVAVAALADVLVKGLGLAPVVMRQPYGRRHNSAFARQGGFCGHLHAASFAVANPKCDPGTRPLERLHEHFEGLRRADCP